LTLKRTLDDLAQLGEKRAGTAAGAAAAEYLRARMSEAGLAGVELQGFGFPRHHVTHASLELSLGDIDFDVLEASAPCDLDAEIEPVGWGDPEALRGRDLRGKIALVERNPLYHRSTQVLNLVDAGAAAAIVCSAAPENLRQVGSVRRAWESVGDLPAITVGAFDGKRIKQAGRVGARLTIEAGVERATGHNVLGVIPGWEPYQIVIGAHYDTWFAGSSDNGGGVALMLALAQRRAGRMRPRYTLTFVAWDGEELALYGGYDHLRRELSAGIEPVLAVLDFETPSAHGADLSAIACSMHGPLERGIRIARLDELYSATLPMETVPELFGGVIPTDIQGFYRSGIPTVTTAVDAPYYHTVEDTPDKVNLPRLEATLDGFDHLLDRLLAEPARHYAPREPGLWHLDLAARLEPDALLLDARVRDQHGAARPMAAVHASLLHDHFFQRERHSAVTDAHGRVTLRFAPSELTAPALLHVTAGLRYPLVEAVIDL
jgi:hypothetical protein